MTGMTSVTDAAHGFIRADDVLSGHLSAAQATTLEKQYGNGNLMRLLEVIGTGGPFTVTSPWELKDSKGQRIINASGYAALPFGDNPPQLNAFLRQVLSQTDQVMFAQQSITTWRAALETNLVRLLARESRDHHDSRVFFSNSGAEAVEAAIKFAQAARPKAKYLINFTRAYHGKTLGALSLTPNPNLQGPFRNILNPAVITLPFGDVGAVERALKRVGDQVIAVILEPILGEAGVRLPPPGFLKRVGELCRARGVLVIADEIQTGLGRTGHWFESVAQGLTPDILTLAKPLGGGMLPVGATIVRHEIYKTSAGQHRDGQAPLQHLWRQLAGDGGGPQKPGNPAGRRLPGAFAQAGRTGPGPLGGGAAPIPSPDRRGARRGDAVCHELQTAGEAAVQVPG